MSLMLRKACQPLLDNVGLQNFHTDIHQHNKNLQIVNECGRPLVNISGITFHRMQPTQPEIEFAVELLDAFLVKYIGDIQTVLDERAKLAAMPDHSLKREDNGIGEVNLYRATPSMVYQNGPFSTRIDSNGEVLQLIFGAGEEATSFDVVQKLKLNNKVHDQAVAFFQEVLARHAQSSLVNKLEAKLASCDI